MNRLRADQLLKAIDVIESKVTDVSKLADDEITLIEQYCFNGLARLDKQSSWLVFNLEQFARMAHSSSVNDVTE